MVPVDELVEDELEQERQTLAKAEQDIAAGEERLVNQRQLMLERRLAGEDIASFARLERLLSETLAEWTRHRDLIRERIVYLEKRLALEE
jgi:hypothetical protein